MPQTSRFWWFLCALGVAGAASAAPATSAEKARAQAAMQQLPLRFESNQGQWQSDIRFRARTGSYTVALTGRGATVALEGGRTIGLSLRGSNAAAAIEPVEQQSVQTNYFVGPRERWHPAVPNYSRIRYRSVYPGIDVVYYGNNRQLEYDFVLAPGADPRSIRLEFGGADRVRVTRDGDLEVNAGGTRVLQKKPVLYQDGQKVSGRYTLLAGNIVGVRVGAYDRTRTLVIDPVLVYSTYLGGGTNDQIAAARVDAKGLLYVAGSTSNADMGSTDGAYNGSVKGNVDVFLAVFDTTGKVTGNQYGLMYLTYIGGSNNDVPTALQIDSQGNFWVTGNTTSTDFPTLGNAVSPATGTAITGFVLQLSPYASGTDSLLWSTFLGGTTGNTLPYGIDLDAAGNVYVVGTTKADDFPVTASAYQPVRWGTQDMFVAEINPGTASPLYATYLGGEAADDGRAIAVTPGGLVYFAATTESTLFPMAGNPYQGTLAGNGQIANYDIILGVIDPTKFGTDSLIYSTYFGGSDNEEVRGLALDAKGNLVITGYTLSTDFPVTAGAVQPGYGGNGDAFVSVVNPKAAGFVVYSTYLGGSDGEVAYGVSTDSKGALYVTGYTLSSDFPVQNAPQAQWGQLVDVFLAKIDPAAKGKAGLQFSTYFGGATVNQGSALAVGSDGTVYTVGYTAGEFPTTQNAHQGGYGGGRQDGFVLILTQ